MGNHQKILLNSVVVYIKIIFNAVITLISTRIVLSALGVEHYGLYTLLNGVMVMLSFLNGALMVSTQRFLSVAIGENQLDKLKVIFNSSITIHLILAVALFIIFFAIQPLLIDHVLNIPSSLVKDAHIIYDIMVFSSICTFLQVPFSAVMNAHEDIYVWAIVEVFNCILKLISAILILHINDYRMVFYTLFIFISLVLSILLKIIWCRRKYSEVVFSLEDMKNKTMLRSMFGFIGWNTLGTSATLVRDQGLAILFNVFYGTVINAAYGVASQINGIIQTFASTITNVFAPSIMKAHGSGDDIRMLEIAFLSSKLSFLISTLTAIPLLLFTTELFEIWLGDVPEYSVAFSRVLIVAFVLMQLTPGMNRVIYAVGNIKWYQIAITVILFLIPILGYVALKAGKDPVFVLSFIVVGQILTTISNVIFSYKECAFNIRKFIITSIIKPIASFIVIILLAKSILNMFSHTLINIVLFTLALCILYLCSYFIVVLSKSEKQNVLSLIKLKK